ncbi:MAG: three-Cys-motif partner protein TcmP [Ktedonobacteraceae bacterium]
MLTFQWQFFLFNGTSREVLGGSFSLNVNKDGELGSPLIAIDAFLEHSYAPMREKGVLFFFIEQDPARCNYLEQLLARRWQGQELPPKAEYEVYQGNFDETMTGLLTELEQRQQRLAPTFAFIDPFGYSHTPMQTITRLMSHPKCEVLITFMYEELNRLITKTKRNNTTHYLVHLHGEKLRALYHCK